MERTDSLEGTAKQANILLTVQSLAVISPNQVTIWGLRDQIGTYFPLCATIAVDEGSRWTWVDSLLCCTGGTQGLAEGNYVCRQETYLLGKWEITQLSDMTYPRGCHGLWWDSARNRVLVFGGITSIGTESKQ